MQNPLLFLLVPELSLVMVYLFPFFFFFIACYARGRNQHFFLPFLRCLRVAFALEMERRRQKDKQGPTINCSGFVFSLIYHSRAVTHARWFSTHFLMSGLPW